MRTTLKLFTLSLLAACGGSSEPFDMARSSLSRDLAPAVDPIDAAQLATDNAAFGMDLYRVMREGAANDQNVFFSPYSISTAFAMTYAGARGETQAEMAKVMHYSLPGDRLHAAFGQIDLTLAKRAEAAKDSEGKPFRLNVVNSTFGQRGYPFERPFLDVLAKNYGAGVRLCDFVREPDQYRGLINDWVADKTETRIRDLLPPASVTTDTRMVLVNAVYFNASWAKPFEVANTKAGAFTRLDGAQVQADMMNGVVEARYGVDETMSAVEVPYEGGQVGMLIVVPSGDFKAFESGVDGKRLQSIAERLSSRSVELSMPKFKIEGASFSLKASLQKLGMNQAFDGARADFTGIVPRSVDQLYIQDAFHKAYVSVDEKGTEAAAATAVVVGRLTAAADPVKLSVNKPFLFFVRDIPTGTVLFAGRVVSPR